jgi:hypothetical protein
MNALVSRKSVERTLVQIEEELYGMATELGGKRGRWVGHPMPVIRASTVHGLSGSIGARRIGRQ